MPAMARDPNSLRESILCTVAFCRIRQVSLDRLLTDYASQYAEEEIIKEVNLLIAEGFLRAHGQSPSPALTALPAARDFIKGSGLLSKV